MSRATVELDLDAVGRASSGNVFSGIWLDVDGLAFPQRGWSDFSVVMLSWWLPSAEALLRLNSPQSLRFMEGPYAVVLETPPDRSGQWLVRCTEQGQRTRVALESAVDSMTLTSSLSSQSRRLLTVCRDKQWWNDDCDALERAINTLERAARRASISPV